jgi:hypothetical protein
MLNISMTKLLALLILAVLASAPLTSAQHTNTNTLSVDSIEAIQSVQSFDKSVPMVAGKETLVRVFLTFDSDRTLRCTGRLTVRRAGVPDVAVNANAMISVAPGHSVDLQARRNHLDQSLDFLLPPTLIVPGKITVSIQRIIDADSAPQQSVSCLNCTGTSLILDFLPVPPLKLRLIGIRYKSLDGSQAFAPRPIDFELVNSWIRRAYPISTLISSQVTIDTQLRWPFSCTTVNAFLADVRHKDINAGSDEATHYYGLVGDGDGLNSMRGCTSPGVTGPSAVGSGPAGDPVNYQGLEWDTDGSLADWYAGHELGHGFGRLHLGVCGSDAADPTYPFLPSALISNESVKAVGFDVGYSARNIRPAILPGTVWNDVMDYCDHQWLSGYTYVAILRAIQGEGSTLSGTPLSPRIVYSRLPDPQQPPADRSTIQNQGVSATKFVSVIGTINFTNRTGKILYVSPSAKGAGGTLTPSDVVVRFKRADDTFIAEYPVIVKADLSQATDKTGLLDVVLPVVSDASAVQLILQGVVLDTKSLGGSTGTLVSNLVLPPDLSRSGLSSDAGEPIAYSLSWTGSSSPNVSYDVQLSSDREKTWQTVAAGLTTTKVMLDPQIIRNIDTAVFRVIATDGLNQNIQKTPLVLLTPKASGELTEDVKWSIWHEGCRVYDPNDVIRSASDLRQCYLNSQGHNPMAMKILAGANDRELMAATLQAAIEIPVTFDLFGNFQWVCLHEAQLQPFLALRIQGKFDDIRSAYYETQLHNPNSRNLLAAVKNAYISEMLVKISDSPPKKVLLPR